MKRLLISSLLGCMLMGQMQAGSLENAVAFAKGAGLGSLALLIPRTIVMIDSGSCENAYWQQQPIKTSLPWQAHLSYLLPGKNLIGYYAGTIYHSNTSPLHSDLKAADNRNNNWNIIAAGLSALLLGGSVAKLCGWQDMPTYISNLMGSEFVTRGIAAGSSASLGLLLANLIKPD